MTTKANAQAARLPLDVERLAELNATERARSYNELGLDLLQRHAAEEAVRLLIAGRYRRAAA